MNSLNTIFDCYQQQLLTPTFYYRQHEHDIKKPEVSKTVFDQCKRVSLVALPFIGLYQPFSRPLSIVSDGLRSITYLSFLAEGTLSGEKTQILSGALNTAISVASIAGTLFAHPLGMLISTGQDIAIESIAFACHMYTGEYTQAAENTANILNNVLYLSLFVSGGLELSIAALAVQTMLGLYYAKAELQKGHYIEGSGHLLMAMIRGHQMLGQLSILRQRGLQEEQPQERIVTEEEDVQKIPTEDVSNNPESPKAEPIFLSAIVADMKGKSLIDKVREAITLGADVNDTSRNGHSPLQIALMKGHTEVAQLLIQNGADLDYRRRDHRGLSGPTLLQMAINNGQFDNADLMLSYGIPFNCHNLNNEFDGSKHGTFVSLYWGKGRYRCQAQPLQDQC